MIYEEKEYTDFINECKSKRVNEGEIHHIRPKSYGGKDLDDNLILLSYADHLHAHFILWKLETSNTKPGPMTKAFFRMMGKRISEDYSKEYHGSIYEQARKDFSIAQSLNLKGRKQSKDHIEKRIVKGKDHPNYGRVYSDDERLILSEKNRKPKSEQTKSKMKIAQQKRAIEISTSNMGLLNSNADRQAYVFIHPEHGVHIGTCYDLSKKYHLNNSKVNGLKHSSSGSYCGWSLNNFTGRFFKLRDYIYSKNELSSFDIMSLFR